LALEIANGNQVANLPERIVRPVKKLRRDGRRPFAVREPPENRSHGQPETSEQQAASHERAA
jgi:hypothetical protein